MSLLFREKDEKIVNLLDETYKDLAIHELLENIVGGNWEEEELIKVLKTIPSSVETTKYRQEILKDFMADKDFRDRIEGVINKIRFMADAYADRMRYRDEKSNIWRIVQNLNEIELYSDIVSELDDNLTIHKPSSKGLCELAQKIHVLAQKIDASSLREDIKKTRSEIEGTQSLIMGVNLSSDLYAEEAFVIEFSSMKMKPPVGFLENLNRTVKGIPGRFEPDPMMKDLTRQVEEHFGFMAKKMKNRLSKYVDLDSKFLSDLRIEFLFYLRIASFGERLKEKGYEISFPNLSGDSRIKMKDFYNIRLAMKGEENIVKNDFDYNPDERIFILTGPNRGGKTILTQGIGLAAYMASQGMFVCASSYEGDTVSNIFTHFPADENQTISYGRLGEEAVRIKSIATQMDERSLILLNETYSTTSATDGIYLAKDLIRIVKECGAMLVYNTHLHELGLAVDELNTYDGKSKTVSIVMEIIDNRNTFRVLRDKPNVSSYAKNVALQYGVTYEQMKALKEKGVQ